MFRIGSWHQTVPDIVGPWKKTRYVKLSSEVSPLSHHCTSMCQGWSKWRTLSRSFSCYALLGCRFRACSFKRRQFKCSSQMDPFSAEFLGPWILRALSCCFFLCIRFLLEGQASKFVRSEDAVFLTKHTLLTKGPNCWQRSVQFLSFLGCSWQCFPCGSWLYNSVWVRSMASPSSTSARSDAFGQCYDGSAACSCFWCNSAGPCFLRESGCYPSAQCLPGACSLDVDGHLSQTYPICEFVAPWFHSCRLLARSLWLQAHLLRSWRRWYHSLTRSSE